MNMNSSQIFACIASSRLPRRHGSMNGLVVAPLFVRLALWAFQRPLEELSLQSLVQAAQIYVYETNNKCTCYITCTMKSYNLGCTRINVRSTNLTNPDLQFKYLRNHIIQSNKDLQ